MDTPIPLAGPTGGQRSGVRPNRTVAHRSMFVCLLVGSLLVCVGLGFEIGYQVVTAPPWNLASLPDQVAPHWLDTVGTLSLLIGVVLLVIFYVQTWVRSKPADLQFHQAVSQYVFGVVLMLAIATGLITASVVSVESRLRGRPLLILAAMAIGLPIALVPILRRSRDPE